MCQCCSANVEESVVHCFCDCPSASRAWRLAFSTMHQVANMPPGTRPWPSFSWEHCLFGTALPLRFTDFQGTWALIRGTVIWTIWLCRNACVFNGHQWTDAHMHQDAILDLGRAHWAQVNRTLKIQPARYTKAIRRFRSISEPGGVFFEVQGEAVRWKFRPSALRAFR
ncbi:hypothetical protein M758_UG240800 [Ceratodon purpureus]|nr:hypothetical protein M758_UG240800 [Ceratodon purpureus]